ncbi:MAG: DUF4302 domain-containing protein [Prevotella sp.]|nr:DUF4302 domain-containing protein [Prevotella sp.]
MKLINKIYAPLFAAAIALLLPACSREEDDIFSSSAAERLTEGAALAAERLESSPTGWSMEYYPTDDTEDPYGTGYLLLVRFDSDGSTTMAMNNVFSNYAFLEDTSAWEVITDNGVVLTFNTYNQCIHAFCNPEDIDFTYSTNEKGYGCEGDYEFIVVDPLEDENPEYITLKGKKRGMYVRLTRLEEGTDYEEYLDDVIAFEDKMFSTSAPNSLFLTIGEDLMQVDDIAGGIPNIYEYGTDAIANESYHPYVVTRHGGKYHLRFRDELTSSDEVTTQELVYDEAQDSFVDPDDTSTVLTGPVPSEFFSSEVSDGNAWQLRRTSTMSDAGSDAFDAVYNDFASMRYTLQYIRLQASGDDNMLCTFYYRNSSGRSGNVSYKLAYQTTDTGLTVSYTGPNDSTAETVIGTLTTIKDFLNVLCGSITIDAETTRFDLTNIKITAADGGTWFVWTLS